MRSWWVGVLAVLLLLGAGCSGSDDRAEKVGRLHRAYVDGDRPNWDASGPRPIATTVWYPAAADSVESAWKIGVFRFGQNALDASLAAVESRPLILLSHGTGGSAAQLSWLAEQLVSAGFIVAGVNHHGNTAAEEATSPAGFLLPGERARDLSVIVDRLLADEALAPHIDATRIGAAGFSLGGYSVLALGGVNLSFNDWQRRCRDEEDNPACRLPPEADFAIEEVHSLAETSPAFQAGIDRSQEPVSDSRIGAIYAIAPALVTLLENEELSALRVPARFVLAGEDDQVLASETESVINYALPTTEVTRIPHVDHYSFLAPCNLRGKLFLRRVCAEPGPISRSDVHERVGREAARFFQDRL